jgi:hypothetical protein
VAPRRSRGGRGGRGGRRGGGGKDTKAAPIVFMISDEEKAQLLAKHGQHLRHRKPCKM